MRVSDGFLLALQALRVHRSRTLLSLSGTAIGVASVLLLTGLGAGARGYVEQQFLGLGTDVLGVLPGRVETTGGLPGFGGVPNDLTLADGETVVRLVPAIELGAPLVIANETVEHDGRSRQVIVLGATAELLAVRGLEMRSGTFLPEGSWRRGSSSVVLGARVARELFPTGSPLGRWVRIGGWRVRVIGVLGSQGRHFGIDMDDTVFLPVATSMRLFDVSSLSRLLFRVRGGRDMARAEDAVRDVLVERHGEEDFTVTTPEAVADSLDAILAVLTLALAGIAAVSLAVAGIGTMNVMLVSISERTAEVGLFKAVGATGRQVLGVFLAEAVTLSALGGVVGLGLGWASVALVDALVAGLPARVVPWAAGAAFSLAVVVGAVFGLLPARRAVRLDPVEALAGSGG